MWTRMAEGGARADRALAAREVYRDRLRLYLERYFDFFGADGSPVHQGRSLTYRFAVAAPIWMGELFDCSPYDAGLSRRAASGALKYFAERGAPDERGILTLGWHDEFLPMVQPYSGPASPYWASKGFLGLLLPPEHRVWTAAELPLPVETGDFETSIAPVGWMLSGTHADGIVRLINHGSDKARNRVAPFAEHTDPNYSPLAFSTVTAPDTAAGAWAKRVGNHVALIAPDGAVTSRGAIQPVGVAGSWGGSVHVPGIAEQSDSTLIHVEGASIETQTFVAGGVETRVHRVTAPAGFRVREGGHPVAGPERIVCGDDEDPLSAFAVNDLRVLSLIENLGGWTGAGVDEEHGANALGAFSATPYLTAEHPGGTVHYRSRVTLHRLDQDESTAAPRTGPS
jgi:hypothetical protein